MLPGFLGKALLDAAVQLFLNWDGLFNLQELCHAHFDTPLADLKVQAGPPTELWRWFLIGQQIAPFGFVRVIMVGLFNVWGEKIN